jgi:hypothetical protein
MDKISTIMTFACVGIFLLVIILLFSMDSLEPLEYGITYNSISKSIGTSVYESGRYIIGPLNSFIHYPANLVTVEFSDSRRAMVRNVLLTLRVRLSRLVLLKV